MAQSRPESNSLGQNRPRLAPDLKVGQLKLTLVFVSSPCSLNHAELPVPNPFREDALSVALFCCNCEVLSQASICSSTEVGWFVFHVYFVHFSPASAQAEGGGDSNAVQPELVAVQKALCRRFSLCWAFPLGEPARWGPSAILPVLLDSRWCLFLCLVSLGFTLPMCCTSPLVSSWAPVLFSLVSLAQPLDCFSPWLPFTRL